VLAGDAYEDELLTSAAAIAAQAGLDDASWSTGWQSAGRTPETWRGPDILQVLEELASRSDVDGVVVCPHGFTADSLEILYDLDVVAAAHAEKLGLQFSRTAMVNDDEAVLSGLAAKVRALTA
jgi:ferrochelatase